MESQHIHLNTKQRVEFVSNRADVKKLVFNRFRRQSRCVS